MKLEHEIITIIQIIVAPFAGAWIEITVFPSPGGLQSASLPSRERGLKYAFWNQLAAYFKSLPSRERGLKFYLFRYLVGGVGVAPFAGAWIEILRK